MEGWDLLFTHKSALFQVVQVAFYSYLFGQAVAPSSRLGYLIGLGPPIIQSPSC